MFRKCVESAVDRTHEDKVASDDYRKCVKKVIIYLYCFVIITYPYNERTKQIKTFAP